MSSQPRRTRTVATPTPLPLRDPSILTGGSPRVGGDAGEAHGAPVSKGVVRSIIARKNGLTQRPKNKKRG